MGKDFNQHFSFILAEYQMVWIRRTKRKIQLRKTHGSPGSAGYFVYPTNYNITVYQQLVFLLLFGALLRLLVVVKTSYMEVGISLLLSNVYYAAVEQCSSTKGLKLYIAF